MPQFFILLLVFLISSSTFAAGFDCAKAATKIEKIICDDAEISKLDDELSAIYKAALKDAKRSAALKSSQQQWLRQRNVCADGGCVRRAYEERLKDIPSSKHGLSQNEKDHALLDAVHTRNKAEVERLLAMGADPNTAMIYFSESSHEPSPDQVVWADASSLLHTAVRQGDAAIVELLLANGADINSTHGQKGVTPLHIAVDAGNREIVELLLAKGADINAARRTGVVGWGGETPLYNAANESHKEIVALLIAKGADVDANKDRGLTPFHGAAFGGDKEIMKMMIAKGADINVRGPHGRTALLMAVWSVRRERDAIELLIAKGMDVNAQDNSGHTPLHWAAFSDNLEIIKLLLANGADFNLKSHEGQTPLQFAIKHNKKEAVKFLSAK